MQKARFNTFMDCWDERKKSGCRCKSNIYQNAASLARTLQDKDCHMHISQKNLYLFVPRHDFFDMLFVLCSPEDLTTDMQYIRGYWKNKGKIRVSVVGIDPQAGELAGLFMAVGFQLEKKLLRMRGGGCTRTADGKAALRHTTSEQARKNAQIAKIRRMYADENRDCMFVATPEDAPEILEILLANFDPIGDNLPELDEILARIAEREVFVLRKDAKIASLIYAEVKRGIGYGYYDVTRPEYRGGEGYNHALACFASDEFAKRGIKLGRWIGWRNAADKRLVKFSKSQDELPEGVVLYNMSLEPRPSDNKPTL